MNENDGAGLGTPPKRRNNRTGQVLALGNTYASGTLESEDSCGDTGDFAIDFDDGGLYSATGDGTDWGEGDGFVMCGDYLESAAGAAWFIWVRD